MLIIKSSVTLYIMPPKCPQSGSADDSIYLTDPNWLRENGQPNKIQQNPTNTQNTAFQSNFQEERGDDWWQNKNVFYAFMDIWNKSVPNQNISANVYKCLLNRIFVDLFFFFTYFTIWSDSHSDELMD